MGVEVLSKLAKENNKFDESKLDINPEVTREQKYKLVQL